MLQAVSIDIAIEREWTGLYEAFWRPKAFATWASGLMSGNLRQDAEGWAADGPEGPIRIRFTAHNPFGILDHWVDLASGAEVYVPIRIVANGEGALVTLTLFRQPTMTDEAFAADQAWVREDLAQLKKVAERR